ncbi:hypothetical protein AB5J55_31550 [Streptomyces sp. R11]|uniref:Uncharacterized protein n=1 Tax=Streptomyces sp. R11 TaxID=3238625 RepID=A0AB39NAB9_9ACTN
MGAPESGSEDRCICGDYSKNTSLSPDRFYCCFTVSGSPSLKADDRQDAQNAENATENKCDRRSHGSQPFRLLLWSATGDPSRYDTKLHFYDPSLFCCTCRGFSPGLPGEFDAHREAAVSFEFLSFFDRLEFDVCMLD